MKLDDMGGGKNHQNIDDVILSPFFYIFFWGSDEIFRESEDFFASRAQRLLSPGSHKIVQTPNIFFLLGFPLPTAKEIRICGQ